LIKKLPKVHKGGVISKFKTSLRLVICCLLYILLIVPQALNSQSLTGLSGGYSIPTADFQEDKTMFFGYSFLNKKYNPEYVRNKKYDYSAGFFTITFLPFAEVSVRITYPNGYNSEHEDIIIGDRMISGRLQPIKEGKYWPSVVIGLQGFYKTTGDGLLNTDGAGASFFNSSYLVLTKNIRPKVIFEKIGVSAGYGSDFIAANTYQFIGFFGGINISPKNMEWLELMLEYDADKWNVGTRITILKHVVLLAGLEGMDAFSFGVNYRFKLP
jgi:hypothetical protein